MTEDEFEKAWDNYEFDSEYSKYIMEHCRGDRVICNGATMIAAMEDGYLYEEFKNSKVTDPSKTVL